MSNFASKFYNLPREEQQAKGCIAFSNGTSFMMWNEYNCDRCARRHNCQIERHIASAAANYGCVPQHIWERMGMGSEKCPEFTTHVPRKKPQEPIDPSQQALF